MNARQLPRRALHAALAVAALTAALVLWPAAAGAVTREHVIVGMPFSGKWGYNVATDKTDDSTGHPSVHDTAGWADELSMDLYADEGTDVYLRLRDQTGALKVSQFGVEGSCGQSLGFVVKVDGAEVGRLYVTHLKGAISASAKVASGDRIGRVAHKCFGVNHVHFALSSTGSNTACWVQKATDAHKNGIDVTKNSPIGELGRTNATGNRKPCRPAAPGTPTCTPSNTGTISTTWKAADTRGYGVRYRYQYQNIRSGSAKVKATAKRSGVFAAGTLGDLYRIRVMAYTEASGTAYQVKDRRPDSPWSAWSARCAARKPPAAPAAPDTEPDAGTITASWDPPASNGAPILEYRVTVKDTTTGTTSIISAGAALTYTYTPPVAGHPVSFAVAARNLAGWGPASEFSDPITADGQPGEVVGDLDGDGYVGCDDLAILQAEYGQTGPDLDGDLNGDGVVNIFDLNILLSNWAPRPGEPACQ